MDISPNLSVDVTSNVLVPEETSWVDVLENLQKVWESGVECVQFCRTQRVRFRPVRLPTQLSSDGFKRGKEPSIGNVETIWPGSKEYDASDAAAAEESTFPNLR